jgi:putative aldouronate transport system substrate-binding protein
MFGAYVGDIHNNNHFWMKDSSGRIKPGITFPEFQDALEAYARWYSEGLINRNFMDLAPWSTADEEIYTGNAGIQCFPHWWGFMYAQTLTEQNNENAVFYPYNLPTVDGSRPARSQLFWNNQGVIVASSDFQNPAALMKVMSLIDSIIYNPGANLSQEDRYLFIDNGRESLTTPSLKAYYPGTDLDLFERTRGSSVGIAEYLQLGFADSAYGRALNQFETNNVIRNELWGPTPLEFESIGNINDVLLDDITKIITSAEPLSSWQQALERWYSAGGQTLENAVNEHFG